MTSRTLSPVGPTLGLLCLALAGPVRAEPPAAPDPSAWRAEPEAELDALRGGERVSEVNATAAELDSQVAANRVGDHATTGSVALSDSAISNVQGIFVSTFNTGNNALIQTNLNVQVRLD